MPEAVNRAWTLAARPQGAPKPSDFELRESAIHEPGPGEVLIATHYHSLDPYMRGRMNPPNPAAYTAGVEIGGVMEADAVGEVIASHSDLLAVGDFAVGKIGWQEYGVMDARDVRKIDSVVAPIPTSLGILGSGTSRTTRASTSSCRHTCFPMWRRPATASSCSTTVPWSPTGPLES